MAGRRAGSTRRWRRQRAAIIDEVRRAWLRDPARPPLCDWCRRPLDPTQAFDKGRNPLAIEVDHVVPRLGARLETESPADLRPLHRRCNRERHWAAVAVVEAIEVEQLSLFS